MTTRKATNTPTDNEPGSASHEALAIVRIPLSEQGPGFLRMLQANGKVMSDAESWDCRENLPLGIEWVLFPNRDLARVGSAQNVPPGPRLR